jgi:ribosomal protein L7/L12
MQSSLVETDGLRSVCDRSEAPSGLLKAIESPADTSRMSAALVVAAILFVVLMLVVRSRRDEKIEMPGASLSTSVPGSVEELMLAGRKIEAIKLLREQTGLGLKEAKEEVERRQRRLQPN